MVEVTGQEKTRSSRQIGSFLKTGISCRGFKRVVPRFYAFIVFQATPHLARSGDIILYYIDSRQGIYLTIIPRARVGFTQRP